MASLAASSAERHGTGGNINRTSVQLLHKCFSCTAEDQCVFLMITDGKKVKSEFKSEKQRVSKLLLIYLNTQGLHLCFVFSSG